MFNLKEECESRDGVGNEHQISTTGQMHEVTSNIIPSRKICD